jgi:hypothetical protein
MAWGFFTPAVRSPMMIAAGTLPVGFAATSP